MGRILYGPREREIEIEVEDRTLAHVQMILVSKLRRSEAFTFSWASPTEEGRTTVWIHPAVPLQFQFDSKRSPDLNQRWLHELSTGAAPGDLRVTEEPDTPPSR